MEIPTDRQLPNPKEYDDQAEYIQNNTAEVLSPEELIQIRTHESLLRSIEKNYLTSLQQWNKS